MTNRTPQMFKVSEVADQWGVSEKTVRRLIAVGDLHCHRVGRQIRVSGDDRNAYVAQRRV